MTRIKAWHGFAGFRLRILLGLLLCALPCDAGGAFVEAIHSSYGFIGAFKASHLTGSASDIYTERVHYAVDGTAAQSPAWPSYRFANRVEDVWAARGDSLPRVALDWQMYYDGLGRLVRGAVPDGSFAEITEPDLDANIRGVRRVFRGAEIQNAVISYSAGMATGVRDVSSPYYGERAGRFPAGDYSLSYDAAGRLTGDGTRGITRVRYSDWSHIPQSIEADGYKVFTEISPDGKLRSRSVNIPYIETVIKVNANGDTIIRYRERTLSRSCSIYGSFERVSYQNRSHFRVNTAAGFHDITEGRRYWYLTNRQGSVMALVDSEGNVHRRSGLFPGGTPFVIDGDENSVPDMGIPSDRHHIGNRWVGFGGLNWYDNTARMHDPLLMHFTAPDPKATTFSQYSPWSHCAANPANLMDLDGEKPTAAEGAAMAAHIYGDKKDNILIGGWQKTSNNLGLKLRNEAGLNSAIYVRMVNNTAVEYAYVTAGTEPEWADIKADITQLFGASEQYSKSVDNAILIDNHLKEEMPGIELTFIGHSLGGSQAALNSIITGRSALTFNPAGISIPTIVKEGGIKSLFKSQKMIDAYIMKTDPLNYLQDRLTIPEANGNRHYLTPKDFSSFVNGHSINSILKSLGIKP